MAAGFLNAFAGHHYDTASAGVELGDAHLLANEVMREIGIDISDSKPKGIAEMVRDHFAYAVMVYDPAKERSPIFPFAPKLLR